MTSKLKSRNVLESVLLCSVSRHIRLDIYNVQKYNNRLQSFCKQFFGDYRNKGIYTEIIILIIQN